MTITLTLNELVLIVIAVSVVVLLGYLTKLLKTLIETAQRTNKVLADVEVISAVAAEKTKAVDEVADELVDSLKVVAGLLKGNQSSVKAVTNVVNSIAGIKNILSGKEKDTKK